MTRAPLSPQPSASATPETSAAKPWARRVLKYPASGVLDPSRPQILEIGPGRGDFLWQLCATRPHHQIIAIETKRRRFEKLWANSQKREITTILLFCGDAREVVSEAIAPTSLDEIHIQFPDPWPKKRHAKHRLMQTTSLDCFLSKLKAGGELHFTTDVAWYAQDVAALFAARTDCESLFSPTPVQTTPVAQFNSFFADKWQKEGRTFYYQIWKKRESKFPTTVSISAACVIAESTAYADAPAAFTASTVSTVMPPIATTG